MLTLFLMILFSSQTEDWELLSTVKIEKGYDEFMGGEIDKPKFSKELISQGGKSIILEGLIIPMENETSMAVSLQTSFPKFLVIWRGVRKAAGAQKKRKTARKIKKPMIK